jgi:hypothetical protein
MPKTRKRALIAASLFVDMFRSISEEVFSSNKAPAIVDNAVICAALYVGECEGRKMTATKISAYVGISRPTVIRRLEAMRRQKAVIQNADKSWRLMLENREVAAFSRAITDRHLKLLHKAFKELSKLDTSTFDATTGRNYKSLDG